MKKYLTALIIVLIAILTLIFAVSCTDGGDNNDLPHSTPPEDDGDIDGIYKSQGDGMLYEFSDGGIFVLEECEYDASANKILIDIFGTDDFFVIKKGTVCLESGTVMFNKTEGDSEVPEGIYVGTDELTAEVGRQLRLVVGSESVHISAKMGVYEKKTDGTVLITADGGGSDDSITINYGNGYMVVRLDIWKKSDCATSSEAILEHMRSLKDREVMAKLEGKTYVRKAGGTGISYSSFTFGKDTVTIGGDHSENNVEYGIFGDQLCYDSAGSSFTGADFRMEGDSIFISDYEFVIADGKTEFAYTVNEDGKSCTVTGTGELGFVTVVPESIDGYTVTAIASYTFTKIEANAIIVIPKTVKTIGYQAFSGYEWFYLFYEGSKEEWDGVSIGSDFNIYIMIRFYSETENNFGWHYVDGVPTLYPTNQDHSGETDRSENSGTEDRDNSGDAGDESDSAGENIEIMSF